jgi:hypothetical protein
LTDLWIRSLSVPFPGDRSSFGVSAYRRI